MKRVKTAREMEMASTSGDSNTVSVSVKKKHFCKIITQNNKDKKRKKITNDPEAWICNDLALLYPVSLA